jgi:hypothetical protein
MRCRFTGWALALALAGAPGGVWAHGSEYVYARLILGPQPRLELSLEYEDNPVVDSPEQARRILERELLLGFGGRISDLAGLAPRAVWGEVKVFPQSAPVPVPSPGEGIDHRLLTVTIDVACPFQLSLKAGSEQAVIYWVDEPGPERPEAPSRWKILLAGDTAPVVDGP